MKAVEKPAAGRRAERHPFPVGELFAAAILLAATLFGCFFLFFADREKTPPPQTALLTETPGLRVLSENPAPVRDGEAHFSVALEESYRFSDLGGGTLDGSLLTFRTVAGGSYTVTLAHPVTLSLADKEEGVLHFLREDTSSEGAPPEELPERAMTCYSDDPVTLRGEPTEPAHYVFSGVLAGDLFYPADDDGAVRAAFPTDEQLEPVFLGREVALRVSAGLRGRVLFEKDAANGDTADENSPEETDPNGIDPGVLYRYGETVTLRAAYDGRACRFLGWSRGGYLRDGGELVSEELTYSLSLWGDSELYANFEALRQYPLHFSAAGGAYTGEERLPETLYGEGDYVSLPVDTGILQKEGFRCIGFTESPVSIPETPDADFLLSLENREDFHSFGSMLLMPGRALTLSAVWIPETDPALLTFDISGSNAAVTGFSSKGKGAREKPDLLILPARTPEGQTVNAVAAGAFENCDFLVKADLPAGVRTVGAGAFRGCAALRSVTLPETLHSLSENAFDRCPALSRLLIHPTLDKVFDVDYDSALADKYLRLLAAEGQKRLILVGGSGCAYGCNSAMLEDAFSDYAVVNLGTAVNYGIRPLLSILESRCREGDVVLFAPEYRSEMYGVASSAITSWQFLESNYDILRDIDLQKNGNLLTSYPAYLQSKRSYLSSGEKKYNSIVYSRASFDPHGDLIAHRQANLEPFESVLPDPGILTEEGLAVFRESLTHLREKGVRCLYSFPLLADPGDVSAEEIRDAEESFLHSLLSGVGKENLTVISRMEDYIFPVSNFYDSMYHATLAGAKRRTEGLIRDLTPYLSAPA